MANTRITQGVIKPNENYLAGIITAQSVNSEYEIVNLVYVLM